MRILSLLFLILAGSTARPALAEDTGITVINFTADWCPTCQIFDPALEQAVHDLNSPDIEWIQIDLTHSRGGSRQQKDAMWSGFLDRMRAEGMPQIFYAYNQYPYTGYAVVLASDTHEPVICMRGALRAPYVTQVLATARNRTRTAPAGSRLMQEHNCPAPFLAQ